MGMTAKPLKAFLRALAWRDLRQVTRGIRWETKRLLSIGGQMLAITAADGGRRHARSNRRAFWN